MFYRPQIEAFVAASQAMLNDYMSKTYPNLPKPVLTVEYGRKYAKVVKEEFGRSVWAFVDLSTGDILKPAGWNAPAKHSRGNVNTPTHGVEFVGPYGPAYLK